MVLRCVNEEEPGKNANYTSVPSLFLSLPPAVEVTMNSD